MPPRPFDGPGIFDTEEMYRESEEEEKEEEEEEEEEPELLLRRAPPSPKGACGRDDAGDAGEPTIPTILNGLETTDSSALRTTCRFEQPSSEPPHLPSSQTSRDSSL